MAKIQGSFKHKMFFILLGIIFKHILTFDGELYLVPVINITGLP